MKYLLGNTTLELGYKILSNPLNSRFIYAITLTVNGVEQIIERDTCNSFLEFKSAEQAAKIRLEDLVDAGFKKQ